MRNQALPLLGRKEKRMKWICWYHNWDFEIEADSYEEPRGKPEQSCRGQTRMSGISC